VRESHFLLAIDKCFEEVLADRSVHADKEEVRTICTVLLEEWRNVPMRQFWTAQA